MLCMLDDGYFPSCKGMASSPGAVRLSINRANRGIAVRYPDVEVDDGRLIAGVRIKERMRHPLGIALHPRAQTRAMLKNAAAAPVSGRSASLPTHCRRPAHERPVVGR